MATKICKNYKEQILHWAGPGYFKHNYKIFTDTTDFCKFDYGDIVVLNGVPFLVGSNEREGRFGIDDQPKLWVKRAINLENGEKKILKFVFEETFVSQVGAIHFNCFRSAKKEARVLELVRGHPNFMQGSWVEDGVGNVVRILDIVKGKPWSDEILTLSCGHEQYYFDHFATALDSLIELTAAIALLHDHGEKHGDIRRDHILQNRQSGVCTWIDFDYDYQHRDNYFGYDLFGLGNLLIFLVGKGDIIFGELRQSHPEALPDLNRGDMNIMFPNRVANLQKIYPYIAHYLNKLLLVFAHDSEDYFDNTHEFLECLQEVRDELN